LSPDSGTHAARDPALIELLQNWRSLSDFKADVDWVWASPWVTGAMPLYTNAIQRDFLIPARQRAGLGKIGWHTLRHLSFLARPNEGAYDGAEGPDAPTRTSRPR